MTTALRTIRAPRGPALSCKGWGQEAALRMLMNNLDPDVAERPEDLVDVRTRSGGESLAGALQNLLCAEATTSLDDALDKIAGWRLEGNAADVLPEILQRGVIPDVLTDQTSAHDALNGDRPHGMSLADADDLREHHPDAYVERSMPSMARHVEAMLALQSRGAVTFDYGNNIRAQAKHADVENAFDIRGFVPEYVRPLFSEGKGPFRWAALSGDPEDIRVTDEAALEMFADDAPRADVFAWRVRVLLRDSASDDSGSRRPSGFRERGTN